MSTTVIGNLLRGQTFACLLVRDRAIRLMRRQRDCQPWDLEWIQNHIGEVGGFAGYDPDMVMTCISVLMQQTKLVDDRLVENWEEPNRLLTTDLAARKRFRTEAAAEEEKKRQARFGLNAGVAQPLRGRVT